LLVTYTRRDVASPLPNLGFSGKLVAGKSSSSSKNPIGDLAT